MGQGRRKSGHSPAFIGSHTQRNKVEGMSPHLRLGPALCGSYGWASLQLTPGFWGRVYQTEGTAVQRPWGRTGPGCWKKSEEVHAARALRLEQSQREGERGGEGREGTGWGKGRKFSRSGEHFKQRHDQPAILKASWVERNQQHVGKRPSRWAGRWTDSGDPGDGR